MPIRRAQTKKNTHKQIVDLGRVVFCEDIATADMKVTDDIDYNDIVFDARVWQVYDHDATTVNNITSKSDHYKKLGANTTLACWQQVVPFMKL